MTGWSPAAQTAWAGSTGIAALDGAFIVFLAHKNVWDQGGVLIFDPTMIEDSDVIARIEEPVLIPPPLNVSTRAGGRFISGQPRTVKLTSPYLRGTIQLAPASPSAGVAIQQAEDAAPNIWMVSGMAFPTPAEGHERVWPYRNPNPLSRAIRSAMLLSEFKITKWRELQGAQSVSGAISATVNYVGRINFGNRP